MKRITSQTVKEEYFTKTLDNGLKVYLIPKPKFHRTYALFATRFGSIDIEFIPDGFSEYLKVPEGQKLQQTDNAKNLFLSMKMFSKS